MNRIAAGLAGAVLAAVAASAQTLPPPDRGIHPCDDFHAYACNVWIGAHPIPSDQSSWGTALELQERNRLIVRDLLEKASRGQMRRNAIDRQIGDYYAACMDEAAIQQRGLAPIRAEMEAIAAMRSKNDLPRVLARLHSITMFLPNAGESVLAEAGPLGRRRRGTAVFAFVSTNDFADASRIVAGIDQAGLALPDRDDYFREDDKSKGLRAAYAAHVETMLRLAGEGAGRAAADARAAIAIETELARNSMDVVKRRNPANLNHKLSLGELQALTPSFDWKAYLAAHRLPPPDNFTVAAPDFLRGIEDRIKTHSLGQWKAYLRWNLLHLSAPLLPKAFAGEDFDFFSRRLEGQKENRARWKRCSALVDRDLGDALGQAYVARAFPPQSKARVLELVHALEQAMDEEIAGLDWMSDATKQQAHIKLEGIVEKIGYPDKWRDSSSVRIDRRDLLGNAYRAGQLRVQRDLQRIGQPADRTIWGMTPPTVDAYYSSQQNTINFPAGILQPPFFDPAADDAINFGGIGAVIGHELTHGFDDQGRKFDASGNLRDWWTAEDAKKFEDRAKCLSDQYSKFVAVDDIHVNGDLTLGENTADIGGLRIALRALHAVLKAKGEENEIIDGLTPDQRFFVSFASTWCESWSPELLRLLARTNPHAPPNIRVNGTVSNVPEFRDAFGCKADQPLAPRSSCLVW